MKRLLSAVAAVALFGAVATPASAQIVAPPPVAPAPAGQVQASWTVASTVTSDCTLSRITNERATIEPVLDKALALQANFNCNSPYTAIPASLTSREGALVHSDDPNYRIAYRVSLDYGQAETPTRAKRAVNVIPSSDVRKGETLRGVRTFAYDPGVNGALVVTVRVTDVSNARLAGSYSDVVTLTVG